MVQKGKDPLYVQFHKTKLPRWHNMRAFGKVGIVSYGPEQNSMKGKLKDRGRVCIHLSLALDHPQDTYRLFDIETKDVISSQDVTWMGRSYSDFMELPKEDIVIVRVDDDEEEEIGNQDDNGQEYQEDEGSTLLLSSSASSDEDKIPIGDTARTLREVRSL